jgi:hypothetical protein
VSIAQKEVLSLAKQSWRSKSFGRGGAGSIVGCRSELRGAPHPNGQISCAPISYKVEKSTKIGDKKAYIAKYRQKYLKCV